eukprot:CAMPEP_0173406254 /NCGR_PEP_ID=MMETSP1356-20130122/64142_1 /TAXON_ID=77927 ORGANISM="Hemiselmis virescens, Strain PCC157" /NCGR_SAMPLE_ID=MMETSP1356 /ASSEMBLY_ACC=CAM_ASM_000847 /LENGTH=53 /DNA_ID=CAMNT_0014367213 /DNA_START=41 /DNA_END=199 /DNA_ORIENTATION=-
MLVGKTVSTIPIGVFLISTALSSLFVPSLTARYGGGVVYGGLYSAAAGGSLLS